MTDNYFIPEHITLAVKHGAAFLDDNEPRGWERKLDLASLDLNLDCSCVLGQLRGDYEDGALALGLDTDGERVVDLGFFLRTDLRDTTGWAQLTEAWRREVRSRLGAA